MTVQKKESNTGFVRIVENSQPIDRCEEIEMQTSAKSRLKRDEADKKKKSYIAMTVTVET